MVFFLYLTICVLKKEWWSIFNKSGGDESHTMDYKQLYNKTI